MLKRTELFEFACKEKLKQVKAADADDSTLALNKERFTRLAAQIEEEFARASLDAPAIESLNVEIRLKTAHIAERLDAYHELRERIAESSFERARPGSSHLYKEFGYLSLIEASRVVSCSSDKTIKVWPKKSGGGECRSLRLRLRLRLSKKLTHLGRWWLLLRFLVLR